MTCPNLSDCPNLPDFTLSGVISRRPEMNIVLIIWLLRNGNKNDHSLFASVCPNLPDVRIYPTLSYMFYFSSSTASSSCIGKARLSSSLAAYVAYTSENVRIGDILAVSTCSL